MNSLYKINIAKEFSKVPLGRFPDDSEFNGTRFREEWLVPALSKSECLEICFDGAEGYGSSFLEESFGGLVRLCGYSSAELATKLVFVSDEDPTLVDEVRQYIAEAVVECDVVSRAPRPGVK